MKPYCLLSTLLITLLALLGLLGVKSPLEVEELPLEGEIYQPVFSPTNANLISFFSSYKGEEKLILLDISRSKKEGRTFFSSSQSRFYPNRSYGIRWSPTGEYLLFLGNSRRITPSLIPQGTIWLIDTKSGRSVAISQGENCFSPSFSPDGKLIATLQGSPQLCSLWIYDLEKRKWEKKLEGIKANCLSWAKEGNIIYLGGDEGIYQVNFAKPKPDFKFFPMTNRVIYIYSFFEGLLIANVLSPNAKFSSDLLPISGSDIKVLKLSGEVEEIPITQNGASHLFEVSSKGMLVYVRNTPLIDDKGTLKGTVSSIWEANRQELLVPYCDGDSKPSISFDGTLLAFVKEGKLCLANIKRLHSSYYDLEYTSQDKELSEKVNWMKQIGIAIMMYVQDYDEKWPLADNLAEALWPYLKNDTLLSILSDPHFHYHSLPPLIDIEFPSQTVLASWEVSPGLWINLYADGVVKVVKKE